MEEPAADQKKKPIEISAVPNGTPANGKADGSTVKDGPSGSKGDEAEEGEMNPDSLEALRKPKTEKMLKAEAKIAKDSFDVEAWNTLVMEALQRDILTIRDTFEAFFEKFPTAGRYWMLYAEMEAKFENHDRVKAIFGRCLRKCPNVELWRFYLSYIQKMAEGKTDAADDIKKAFEFSLDHVGLDISSYPIWNDYINYLKVPAGKSSQELQEASMACRRVYQRAVVQPILNVEVLWNSYTAFENGLNKTLASKILRDLSQKYMLARAALKERKNFMDLINRNALARPPLGLDKEEQQLVTWKSLIAWEKSNPLQLDSYSHRVLFTYRQAFMALRFYPEIWVDAAQFLNEVGQSEEAIAMFKQGIEALPSSLILTFSYAEFEETRKKTPEARAIFEGLLAEVTKEREALAKELEGEQKAERDREKERQKLKAEKAEKDAKAGKDQKDTKEVKDSVEKDDSAAERILQLEEDLKKKMEQESLIYIMFMRFSKRAEDEPALRALFRRARESPACTYHIFVASALMQPTKQIVCNIFEFGLKKFGTDPNYVLHYINYLWHFKDDSSQNLRSLFERTLASMPSDKARIIWQKYLEYELYNGDLSSIKKVEERIQKAYPDEPFGVLGIIERYRFLDILPCNQKEFEIYSKLGKKISFSELQANMDNVKSLNLPTTHTIDKSRFPRPNMEMLVKYNPENLGKPLPPPVGNVPLGARQSPVLGNQVPQPRQGSPPPISVQPLILPPPPQPPVALSPLEALGRFLSQLPPASSFQGSHFNTDELMGLILRANFAGGQGPPPGAGPAYHVDAPRDDPYGQKRKYMEDDMGGPYGRDREFMGGRRQYN